MRRREKLAADEEDPELQAAAKKKKWDLDPTGGAELEVTAKEIMVQPPEVIARIKKLLAE